MAKAIVRHDVLQEIRPREQRSEHMCLLGSHSWIWVLDQAYCKFISQPSEYEHGDKGGMWYFSLEKIIPVIDGYKYRHIIVVAGSARKLMYLPSESQLLCPDFTESMVRDPASDTGLLDVLARLENMFQANQ